MAKAEEIKKSGTAAEKDEDEALKNLSVEEAFKMLQKILSEMEDEDATLEKSFENYEKGMKLIRICNEKIDGVEKKVKVISGDGSLEDFD